MMPSEEDEEDERTVVALNTGAGGSHPRATTDPEEEREEEEGEEAEEQQCGGRKRSQAGEWTLRPAREWQMWADCVDEEPEEEGGEEEKQKAEDDSSLVVSDDKTKDLDNLSSWSDNTAQQNLFKIKESMDKGLADMETGSEVYMSELLVSIKHRFCFLTILFPLGWL